MGMKVFAYFGKEFLALQFLREKRIVCHRLVEEAPFR